jgi:hypothetical protein
MTCGSSNDLRSVCPSVTYSRVSGVMMPTGVTSSESAAAYISEATVIAKMSTRQQRKQTTM